MSEQRRREFWICLTQRIGGISSCVRTAQVPEEEKDWYDEIHHTVELRPNERIFTREEIERMLWFHLSDDNDLVNTKTKNAIERELNELFNESGER